MQKEDLSSFLLQMLIKNSIILSADLKNHAAYTDVCFVITQPFIWQDDLFASTTVTKQDILDWPDEMLLSCDL